MLGDYCDGELFLTSELFQEDPCALQIQLYYDEVEVCNPIGSKVKKHKLGKKYVCTNLPIVVVKVCNTFLFNVRI